MPQQVVLTWSRSWRSIGGGYLLVTAAWQNVCPAVIFAAAWPADTQICTGYIGNFLL